MHNILVVLNSRAGTLLDRDPDDMRRQVEIALRAEGRWITVLLEHGRGVARAIERAASGACDTIIVGGGDGSVSCAAQPLAHKPIGRGARRADGVHALARRHTTSVSRFAARVMPV